MSGSFGSIDWLKVAKPQKQMLMDVADGQRPSPKPQLPRKKKKESADKTETNLGLGIWFSKQIPGPIPRHIWLFLSLWLVRLQSQITKKNFRLMYNQKFVNYARFLKKNTGHTSHQGWIESLNLFFGPQTKMQ